VTTEVEQKPSALDPSMVQEFVAKAHADLSRVRELLDTEPNLVNAAYDWGGGDWETGLGAAAHMGRADIAGELIQRGARLDIFSAAMLGRLEIVRATLSAYPEMARARGPHGIPLEAHAAAGGDAARPVAEYIRSVLTG
jgi:hypothetical protein